MTLSEKTTYLRPVALTLQMEGLAIGAAAVVAFAQSDSSWLLFALLILAPDLAMLGYLAGNRVGAFFYNLAHSYLLPLALVAAGIALQNSVVVQVALIWIAHIGFDRAIGYGLKYAMGFKETHLARV